MHEYRAYYVGYQAQHRRPYTQQEAYEVARHLVTSPDLYADISATFNEANSPESDKIVEFMAQIIGADPATATTQSVLNPGTLSQTEAAIAPVAAGGGSNNLTNYG
jgi:hypothetical protein